MNINVSIPLISALFYFVLFVCVINTKLNKTKYAFLWYLVATMFWSLSSFFAHAYFFPEKHIIIHELLIAFGFLVPVAFFHFTVAFTGRDVPFLLILSLLVWSTIVILDFGGFILQDSYVINHIVFFKTTALYYVCYLFISIFLGFGIYFLVKKYRTSNNPIERNRIAYLLAGVGVNLAFVSSLFFDITAKYPIDHVGNLCTIGIFTYAIMKYQLLDIKFVARRGLAYALLIIPLVAIYTGLLFIGQQLFPETKSSYMIITSACLAVIFSLAAHPLWVFFRDAIDRLFYRNTFAHRQKLLSLSNQLGNVINLVQLADKVLPALCKVLKANSVHLILEDISTGNFRDHYSYPENEENSLVFDADSPVIAWLEKKNYPLNLQQIPNIPEFKGLWQKELEQLTNSPVQLLTPIKNQGELVGIFAIGKKVQNVPYSQEDLEMMLAVAGQVGIIIENAQNYSQALLKANTDGLTQLYNHRHFHERLEQEIARSSRFGTVFSIIMLDIDLFKIYNDNFGHLAGDEILRKIGEYIKGSIRSIDIAARYGGEEFAIILPETRLSDAYFVAERIRKTIETKTSQRAMPVTVSIGVASWPVDGVMKEELIKRADAALYIAKQTGRNRTVLSTDIIDSRSVVQTNGHEINPRALNIIYALAATVDAKDHYTYGHSRKVSEYAVTLAEAVDLPPDKKEVVRIAGLLHDIGKIGIPDSILNKKEPLSHEEWEPIKAHTQLGVAILRHIVDLANCLPAIQHHHEHYDGTGYPSGLKGKQIPIESRILAIADAYEAMTSPRIYRKQLKPEEALEELRKNSGAQFDPDLVGVFCKILEISPQLRKNSQ